MLGCHPGTLKSLQGMKAFSLAPHPLERLTQGLSPPSADEGPTDWETSVIAGRKAPWCSHSGKWFSSFLKSQTYTYHMAKPCAS